MLVNELLEEGPQLVCFFHQRVQLGIIVEEVLHTFELVKVASHVVLHPVDLRVMRIQTQKDLILAIIELIEVVSNISEVLGVQSKLVDHLINLSPYSCLNVLLSLAIFCQCNVALIYNSTDFLSNMSSQINDFSSKFLIQITEVCNFLLLLQISAF